jgi:formylglycine-generating enzyme required for sulfatase activity
VLRGGSWNNPGISKQNCRVANRSGGDPDNRNNNNGFRLSQYNDKPELTFP